MSKADRDLIRSVQGQINEVRFGPGMRQNADGTWSPYLDPRGPQRFGANGEIQTLVGEGMEITTGSPRAIRVKRERVLIEAVQGLPEQLTEQEETIDTKASKTELDAVSVIASGKSDPVPDAELGTRGLVLKAEAMDDLDPLTLLPDLVTAFNTLLASLRASGQMETK